MQLEDHVGDVLAKARGGCGLSVAEAAELSGLPVGAYGELERAGRCASRPNWVALAERLGLGPARLEALAGGWRPQPRDLTIWRELRQITTSRGIDVNSYLLWDEVTREAAMFDTGWELEGALAVVTAERLTLEHLFLTHGHPDHIAAVAEVRQRFPKIRLHSNLADAPVSERNRPGDFIHLGSLRITNRATPGHSEDGVTYIVGNWPDDAPGVAIVGDAIFAGSMGKAADRFDLARQRVREQILSLPAETLVCPGHGPVTTVGDELRHNPFFP